MEHYISTIEDILNHYAMELCTERKRYRSSRILSFKQHTILKQDSSKICNSASLGDKNGLTCSHQDYTVLHC